MIMKHKMIGLTRVEDRGQGQLRENKMQKRQKTHLGLGEAWYTQLGIEMLSRMKCSAGSGSVSW